MRYLLFASDSYRSFYPDYTCYRYRRSTTGSGSTKSEQIVSKEAEITKNHKNSANSKKLDKTEPKKKEKSTHKPPKSPKSKH